MKIIYRYCELKQKESNQIINTTNLDIKYIDTSNKSINKLIEGESLEKLDYTNIVVEE